MKSSIIVLNNIKYKTNLHIQHIPLQDVLDDDKKKYNSNNHWPQHNVKPSDYESRIEQCNTKHWIGGFHGTSIPSLAIEERDLRWLKKASAIGTITKQVSGLYEEDIEDAVERYNKVYPQLFPSSSSSSKYFIRCENVSLKNGLHGIGPYFNFKQIFESLVTCAFGHQPIEETTKSLTLYFFPFVEFEKQKEFRVFVHDQNITAISQQYLYHSNPDLESSINETSQRIIQSWVEIIILDYFETQVKPFFESRKKSSYIYDFCILKQGDVPYFIEENPWGPDGPSGSSLFHWIDHQEILFGEKHINNNQEEEDSRNIYFRFTTI
jgi:hypothetical protein